MVLNPKIEDFFFLSPPLTTFVCRLEDHAIKDITSLFSTCNPSKLTKLETHFTFGNLFQ